MKQSAYMKIIKKINYSVFLTYIFFGFLFWHFAKEMLQVKYDGWYVGQVNLYGDLVYHLALINKFLSFPTILIDSPIYAGSKVNYPIFADYITAKISQFTGIDFALFVTTLLGGILVLIVTHLFTKTFFNKNAIWSVSTLIFFMASGFGFVYFIQDFGTSNFNFTEFMFNIPREYTDLKDLGYWWINPFLAYFLPQRGFLFAFPITLTTLLLLYRGHNKSNIRYFFIAGLLSGTLPLVQAHSLLVLFILCTYYFLLSLIVSKFSKKIFIGWVIFGVATASLALPLFQLISSVENPVDFIRLAPGWTSKENFFWFWLKNLGIFMPLLLLSIFWSIRKKKIFLLYLPFLFIFAVSNIWIFQPWEFDNSKLLIYWFFASSLLVAYFLYDQLFSENLPKKTVGIILIFVMVISGSIDIWRTFTKVSSYQIFSKQDLEIGKQTQLLTPNNAVFVTAPNHNHPIPTLSGRSTLIGFHGWVWSHGSDYLTRSSEVNTIYQGGQKAEELIKKHRISYVTAGPQEIKEFSMNLSYFRNFPQINLGPGWVLYDVSYLWSNSNR